MQCWYGSPQDGRSPDFTRPGSLEQMVARGVTLDTDGIQTGFRVGDGKIKAKGVAFLSEDGRQSKPAEILENIRCKAVGFAVVLQFQMSALAAHSAKKRPSGWELSI